MSYDTNLYWALRGTYAERKEKLAKFSRDFLEAAILDDEYNDFISRKSEKSEEEGGGKRIPYIGWYWRHIEFSDLTSIPIGDCGYFIGFMAKNKWDFPERKLTEEEGEKVMGIIDEAMRLNQQGGFVGNIDRTTNEKLSELWDYMQTLKI